MTASFGITTRQALIVARREVRDQFRDWRIIAPMLVLTVFFPVLMNFTADQAVTFVERYGADPVGDRLIPFLLMVVGFFPISVSLVIALESFVGEKERHSLEPLLATPLSDSALYAGKMLASIVPPLLASCLGIGVYLVGLWFSLGWSPPPILLIQVVVLTAAQAFVMVSGAVVVSAQTTSVRAANLLASFIIIPMALLVQVESVVMFWARYHVLWWIVLGLVLLGAVLVRMGVRLFSREELLGRDLDQIDLRHAWKTFRQAFLGQATGSVWTWYRGEVFPLIGRLGLPLLVSLIALVAAGLAGGYYASILRLPPQAIRLQDLSVDLGEHFRRFGLLGGRGAVWIWLVNMRALALATVGGVFTFGVLGLVLLMLPIGLVGYFAQTAALAGIPLPLFLAVFVLPHGLAEIPAAVLIGAAVVRLGASLLAPPAGKTVGERWLEALADWAKVAVGLVIPLLIMAALLETFVTPRVVLAVFG